MKATTNQKLQKAAGFIHEQKILIASLVILIVCALYSGAKMVSEAAERPFNSKGRIVYDNGTEDPTDDVIFDASDFDYLYDLALEPYVPE